MQSKKTASEGKKPPEAVFLEGLRVAVAVGVIALPTPGIAAHVVQRLFRLPAKQLFGLGGVRVAAGHIARPAVYDDIGNPDAVDTLEGIDRSSTLYPVPVPRLNTSQPLCCIR